MSEKERSQVKLAVVASGSQGLGFVSAILSMTVACLGQAMLSIGSTFRNTGIVLALLMLCLSAFLSHINCLYTSRTMDELAARGEKPKSPEEIAKVVFKRICPGFAYTIVVFINMADLGLTSVSALIFATKSFQLLLITYRSQRGESTELTMTEEILFYFFTTLLVSASAFVHEFVFLRRIAWLTTTAMIVMSMIMCLTACITFFERDLGFDSATLQPSGEFVDSFGNFVFCFALAANFTYIKRSMKKPNRAAGVSGVTHILVTLLYAFIGSVVLIGFGVDQEETVMENHGFYAAQKGLFSYVASVCLTVAMIPGFFFYSNPVFCEIEEIFQVTTYHVKVIVRLILLVFLGIACFFLRNHVTEVIETVGSVTTNLLCMVFPSLFHIMAKRQGRAERRTLTPGIRYFRTSGTELKKSDKVLGSISIILGCLLLASGVSSRIALISQYSFN